MRSTCLRRPWGPFLPPQDLLAIDSHLRRANPHDEQIDVPANPTHFWKYRLHLPLGELVNAVSFNEPLQSLVAASGCAQLHWCHEWAPVAAEWLRPFLARLLLKSGMVGIYT